MAEMQTKVADDAEPVTEELQEVVEAKQEPETSEVTEDETSQEEGYRFNQFDTSSPENYIKAMEKSLLSSQSESKRLAELAGKTEAEISALQKLVGDDPELKSKLSERLYGTSTDDRYEDEDLTPQTIASIVRDTLREEIPAHLQNNPTLKRMEDESSTKNREIVEEFQREHPDLIHDVNLQAELEETFGIVASKETQKGTFDMKRALERSWKIVNADKEVDGAKRVIQKEKASQGSVSSQPTKEASSTKKLTEAEKFIADKLNLTPEQYLNGKRMREDAQKATIN